MTCDNVTQNSLPIPTETSTKYCLTSVFVLGLVHLTISAFTYDANYIKFIYTALAPVTLGMFALSVSWAANPGNQEKEQTLKTEKWTNGRGRVIKETDFGLFLRVGWGRGGASRTGDCGGDELAPGRVGGKGRSMSDGRLRTSFSFLDSLCGGVDFFGL